MTDLAYHIAEPIAFSVILLLAHRGRRWLWYVFTFLVVAIRRPRLVRAIRREVHAAPKPVRVVVDLPPTKYQGVTKSVAPPKVSRNDCIRRCGTALASVVGPCNWCLTFPLLPIGEAWVTCKSCGATHGFTNLKRRNFYPYDGQKFDCPMYLASIDADLSYQILTQGPNSSGHNTYIEMKKIALAKSKELDGTEVTTHQNVKVEHPQRKFMEPRYSA